MEPIKITREEYAKMFLDEITDNEPASIPGLPKNAQEWKEAGEGAAIAYNTPVTQDVPQVLKPTVSVGEGIVDTTLGVGAGINETFADIIDFFDGDGNAVADWLRQGAKDLKSKQFKSNGAGSAVGEELGNMAVTSAAGSAAGKVVGEAVSAGTKLAGKALPNFVKKPFRQESVRALFGDETASASKGVRGIEKIGDDLAAGRRYDANPSVAGYTAKGDLSKEIINRASKNAPNVASTPLTSLAGLESLVQKVIGSNTPYSKQLAAQAKSLVDRGVSPEEALRKVLEAWRIRAAQYKPADIPSSSKIGGAAGTLFGVDDEQYK